MKIKNLLTHENPTNLLMSLYLIETKDYVIFEGKMANSWNN